MIRVFLINLIIILFLSSKSLIAADMSGYLLSKAIKDFNDNNYEAAYKSLSNIVPTGNPVAAYLLGQMYLKGLGIEIDHEAAYEMIYYSSQKLFNHDQALALESQ
ncbi:MAG: SEL1-like repeat protein, partial [Alphaproteobacteria bacterium]|nr:SEL1-like repeat protein [Alphaproteobacteria bacterium]